MKTVLTRDQALKATRGRTPHLPLEYETAVKALTACMALDDAKYWSDKADAFAAWAKIFHSDDAARKARALKLHAYRRMGQLAQELRPNRLLNKKMYADKKARDAAWRERKRNGAPPRPHPPSGQAPGPRSLLMQHGFSEDRSATILRVSRVPEEVFQSAVSSTKPPSPTRLVEELRDNVVWRDLSVQLHRIRGYMKKHKPHEVAAVATGSWDTAKELAVFIVDWLDEFERRLRKNR